MSLIDCNLPFIGITAAGRGQTDNFYLPSRYVEAVRVAGGLPVLLPPGETQLAAILERLDGIVFSGGGDIDPEAYNGASHPTIYNVDRERDRFELALAKLALSKDIPILGICRGLEVLVVTTGGNLVTHLPDEVGETVAHRSHQSLSTEHGVKIDPKSRLAKIMGTTEATVASWHHQAAKVVPTGWRVTAWADDGVIEAIEYVSHPWAIAIQWHPELSLDDPIQQRLLEAFITAVNIRKQKF